MRELGFREGIAASVVLRDTALAFVLTCAVLLASVEGAMAHGHHRAIVTESGPLNGLTVNGINEYLGIPYAAPPVGSLRWIPPQPFGTWPGVLQATQFGNECPQAPNPFGKASSNEDCLFLNVYTPSGDEGEGESGAHAGDHGDKHRGGRAVMVWIHGGGLIVGGGDLFDPTPLVRRGVIIVTINYRLGLLGFFAQPALDGEGHLAGNYGLMD